MPGLLKSMPLSLALGLTLFLGSGRSRVSVATAVSVLGIGVGVATLMAVLAVTGGFEDVFREKILGVYPHMVVLKRYEPFTDYAEVTRAIKAVPGVTGASPSTYDEMMVSSDHGSAGAIVKGVDLDGIREVSNIEELTGRGTLDELRFEEGGPMGVLLGCDLMRRLGVRPGDRVTLTTPVRGLGGAAGPLGMAPMEASFVVEDCFSSGFYEYDSRLVVMDLAAAQRFLDRGPEARWVEVRLLDMFDTDGMRREILSTLERYTLPDLVMDVAGLARDARRVLESEGERPASLPDLAAAVAGLERSLLFSEMGAGPPRRFRVIDWKEMNRNMFSALRMQKVVLALFFLIIVVVAAFNMVGTQLVVARERIKEISTLVALGASRRRIYEVFVVHGLSLGLAGVAVGMAMGWGVIRLIQAVGFDLDAKVYHISRLPAVVDWGEAATVAGLSVAVVLVSCLVSSARAARIDPIVGLRKIA